VACFHRDERYAQYVKTQSGKATRRLLHGELLNFLANTSISAATTMIKMVDSTNGDAIGRQLYVATAQAQLVVLVNFNCADVEFLLQRTIQRLGDNPANHPLFPTTVAEQRAKHERILQGIQYAEQEDYDQHGPSVTAVVIDFDPTLGQSAAELSFQVYCTLFASRAIVEEIGIGSINPGCNRKSGE
jgi:hypothetical protein